MAPTTWSTESYGGWNNCRKLSTESYDLTVTTDVGPRIINLTPRGGVNLFKEYDEQIGAVGGDQWRIFGGHRLWHAPEHPVRTYVQDNLPVEVIDEGDSRTFVAGVEPLNNIQKILSVAPSQDGKVVTVTHRIVNRGRWPVTLAPWALTALKQGGEAFVPLPQKSPHGAGTLEPSWSLACWPYTDFSDRRFTWGNRFLRVAQDPSATSAQKIGIHSGLRWAGYAVAGSLFLKSIDPACSQGSCADYPDRGSQWEVFSNADMLEIETLGKMVTLEPSESVTHIEHWLVRSDWSSPGKDDELYSRVSDAVQILCPQR